MSGELGDHVGELVSADLGLIPDFPEPGILFRDITPLVTNGTVFRELMQVLGGRHAGKVDAVAGLESRGFVLGAPLATELGIGMLTICKTDKLPGHVIDVDYALGYGNARIEIHPKSVTPGARILVIDDVFATGGTAGTSVNLLRQYGAEVATVAVLLELEALSDRKVLADKGVSMESVPLV